MERDKDKNPKVGNVSMPDLEGVAVEEEGAKFSHLPNAPIMDLLVQPLAYKYSSWNTYFVVPTPSKARLNPSYPDETIAPIFGPNAPFWETSLG